MLIIELHDWLLPQKRTSAPFLSLVARMHLDFVVRGENVFVFNWTVLAEEGCQARIYRQSTRICKLADFL